jgi:hypothetical protein
MLRILCAACACPLAPTLAVVIIDPDQKSRQKVCVVGDDSIFQMPDNTPCQPNKRSRIDSF